MKKIYFRTGDLAFNFKKKENLKIFIESIFKKEKNKIEEINYIFCSDEMLLQINQDFLQHDYYTDIITFDLSERNQPINGEIYISIDRVKDNAKIENTTFEQEMLRVIFHGALHLCGYKDKSTSDIQLMRAKENHYIQLYLKQLS